LDEEPASQEGAPAEALREERLFSREAGGDMGGSVSGGDAPAPTEEVLAGLLSLAHATAENMVYLRERVDQLHKRIDALQKLWE
jgi:hypothetical protein